MALKDNDFVEIDFTGKIKETGMVFDTTIRDTAREGQLDPKASYNPAIICLGRNYIFKKIEDEIKSNDIDKSFTLELIPEEAFGKKDAKLIQTMSTSAFRKEGINPQKGMNVTVNDRLGVIRTVNGGRCMVDFNHPLSGKDVVYDVKILKKITDNKEKVEHIIETELRVKDFKVNEIEKDIVITFDAKISKILTEEMKKILKETIKEITGIIVKIK